jgi:hypothetical protein
VGSCKWTNPYRSMQHILATNLVSYATATWMDKSSFCVTPRLKILADAIQLQRHSVPRCQRPMTQTHNYLQEKKAWFMLFICNEIVLHPKKVHTKVRSKSFSLYLVVWLWEKPQRTADLNVWVQVLNNFRLKHIYKTPENSHAHCWDQVYNLRWTMRGNIWPLLQCEIFCEVHTFSDAIGK